MSLAPRSTSGWERWLPHVAWMSAAVIFVYCALEVAWNARAYDLSALLIGTNVLRSAPAALYDHDSYYYNLTASPAFIEAGRQLGFEHAPTPFVHPPLIALLARPMAVVPFGIAARGWLILSIAAMVGSLALLVRYLVRDLAFGYAFALTLLLTSLFDPSLYAFWLGQTTPFIFFLGCVAITQAQRRPQVAGVALAVAIFVKLTPLALLVPWLVTRNLRALRAVALTVGALALLSWVVCGIELNLMYMRRVLEIAHVTLVAHNNQSFTGALVRATSSHVELFAWPNIVPPLWADLLGKSFGLAGLALTAWLAHQKRERMAMVLALLTMLLAPAISWSHYFVFLLPAAMLLQSELKGVWRALPVLPLLALLRPVAVTKQRFGPGPFEWTSTPFFVALALLLMALLHLHFGRKTRNVPNRAVSS